MKRYKLRLDLKKVVLGVTLFRIEATVDSKYASKGDLGGWIEKEANLDTDGDAWVYGDAQVYGDAWVYGDARVYGDAQVKKKRHCIIINNLKFNITITLGHIAIGCEMHTITHWKKNIKKIGMKHGYTSKEIEGTILMIKGALMQRSGK